MREPANPGSKSRGETTFEAAEALPILSWRV